MSLTVTVVGVGMVGEEIVSILRERNFPMEWPPRICATRTRSETLALVVWVKGATRFEHREDDPEQLRHTGNDGGLGAFTLSEFALVVSL